VKLLMNLVRDEEGASLVEYTVLLGIITVAVIGTIIAVGGWVDANWTGLCNELNGEGAAAAACVPS
jgi:pilus assembly protein Flp/PilA